MIYSQGEEEYRTTASDLYYPSEKLEEYFATKKYVHFLEIELYRAEYDSIQIEPITSVNMWKGQNIFTLIGLDSFEKPETEPYDYNVKLLTTQYRSIPTVGRIYSELTYGGMLKSAREESSQKQLNIG